MIANYQVDRSELVILSARGCHVPGVQVIWANFIRDTVIKSLQSEVADGAFTEQALVCACNLQPEALWWIEHKNEARSLIVRVATTLQSLRHEFFPVHSA